MKRPWHLVLVGASFTIVGGIETVNAAEWVPLQELPPIQRSNVDSAETQWTPLKNNISNSTHQHHWEEINATTDHAVPKAVVWNQVDPTIANEIEDKFENEDPITNPANVEVTIKPPFMPSGPTFANDKAIWRDDTWHPQISGTVPVGFGPTGLMISGSIWAIDCVTGAGFCRNPDSWKEYKNQIEFSGEAQYNLSIGFGDANKLAGVTVTTRIEETKLPFGERNTQGLETDTNLLDDYYIGVHLSRNLGIDTAFKLGIDNWLDVRACDDCGYAKSAYGVISQRIRLRDNQNSMFSNAYMTFGFGNGQFRPLDELVLDGIRKQRDAGCATPGFTPDKNCSPDTLTRASIRARSYGQINPIGAVALETLPGLNLIGEWSGRNLNAGFSVRPFEDFGLIFTGMWENILPNCDWGCTVSVSGVPDGIDLKTSLPDALTERPRFSFQASLELKF